MIPIEDGLDVLHIDASGRLVTALDDMEERIERVAIRMAEYQQRAIRRREKIVRH